MTSGKLVFREFGEPESVLQWETGESPELVPSQVRVRIRASPVNPADINFIQGRYGTRPDLPAMAGMEAAGEILESASADWKTGQRVMISGPGLWAGEVVVSQDVLHLLPDELDFEQGAMARINPATAWMMLHEFCDLVPGSWVVQNSASSMVGRSVIQIAAALGLRTLNFLRNTDYIAELQALGADAVFLDEPSSVAHALEVCGEDRPMLGLNGVGGDSLSRLVKVVGDGATMVTYGAMARQPVQISNAALIFRDLRFRGFWLTKQARHQGRVAMSGVYDQVLSLISSGRLRLPVRSRHGFDSFSAAISEGRKSGGAGKVLFVSPTPGRSI